MLKPQKYNIAETNIAMLGSDLEKKVRRDAAEHEPAWHVAGKEPGLQIWRVEKFKIVPWPTDLYGKFYDGDSYICLKTYKSGRRPEDLSWDIHYWLGGFSSQDEVGTAAYKTVELDDFLGGGPTQYQEIQEHESSRFLSLFPNVQYLSGGVESGFRHVGPEQYEARLLHVKGKRFIRVLQVPLERDSLNSGDVFILDAGLNIYVFNGARSSLAERKRAFDIASNLDDSRKGLPEVWILKEDGDRSDPKWAEFWSLLGGEGPIKSAAEGGSDEDADRAEVAEHKLLRLSDASGSLTFEHVHSGEIKRSMLDSSDVFVVDIGEQIFVWVGKNSSAQEKRFAMKYGQDYIRHAGRPLTLPLAKFNEGHENEDFFQYVKLR